MKKVKFTTILVFSFFLLWFSYVAISLASFPLRDPLVNEKEKNSALGLTASLPTEYLEDGSLFWWITDEGIMLNYRNNINETVNGQLRLRLSGNPCNKERTLQINENGKEQKYLALKDEKVIDHIIEVSLEPYENFVISMQSVDFEECYVTNGDPRNFVARLDGWIFE